MKEKLLYKDEDLLVWTSEGDITVACLDRGLALSFDSEEWDKFLTKMLVIGYNEGLGLIEGFSTLYGTLN